MEFLSYSGGTNFVEVDVSGMLSFRHGILLLVSGFFLVRNNRNWQTGIFDLNYEQK